MEYFNLLFTADIWDYVVRETNAYAAIKLARLRPRQRSLYSRWHDVTVPEMKAFIAITFNMGIVQLPSIKEYWSTNECINIPFFRSVMSRDRFEQILGVLHVGSDGTTRKGKVQPFIDLLVPKFSQAYTPAQHIAVDEAMISFRGRASFKQYVRGKPHPWGIKAYVLSESATGYLHQVVIYYGRETELIQCPGASVTVKIVITLAEPLKSLGYSLYCDRFYSSPDLATRLLEQDTTFTGTVMANRRGLPAAVKSKRKEARGNIKSYQRGQMMVLQWQDKRKIVMLSTKHTNDTILVPPRYVCACLCLSVYVGIHVCLCLTDFLFFLLSGILASLPAQSPW